MASRWAFHVWKRDHDGGDAIGDFVVVFVIEVLLDSAELHGHSFFDLKQFIV